jgi:hypothetical protein
MQIGCYRISATLLDDAILPPYKGSTFRGAFGGCLKRAVCAVKQKECSDCLLSSRCVYARLFEAKQWDTAASVRTAAPPHPYIIQPPNSTRTRYQAGEPFDFNLFLFGEMNASLPYFVYAFELMGEQGIGKKNGNHRARFCLKGVSCGDVSLYSPQTGKLAPTPPPEQLALAEIVPSLEISQVTIRLQTPLRLKSDNHLQATLPFSVLVRSMLRRVSGLFNAWGAGEPPLDYRGMVARAEQVKVIDGRLRWHDWERYSNRQEQAMNFGGILGYATYQGALAEYLPLIKLCQQLSIGKQTTFGLGRFSVEESP